MSQLTLYTNPMSRGRIARWMLEETGQPYKVKLLSYGEHMNTPEYLKLNPMGKVPALTHGDAVVTECAAICAYLADAFPEAGLAPKPGSFERAAYYRWLFFAAGPVEASVTNKALGVEIAEDKRAMVGYGTYDRVVSTLEKAVCNGPYLCGNQFTAADVYFGAQIGWGLRFGNLPSTEPLTTYWARLAERPAWKVADELSNKDMDQPSENQTV